MFNIVRKELEWAGRPLILETGRVARQSDGAVMITYGETVVLATVVAAKAPKEGVDFFPLTVHYQEKSFAAGKIPGGFFKREGRPSEKEILTSRLIDRPIRPLFAEGFRNETQVICTVLTHDLVNDPDIVAMIGTSAALAIAGLPFEGPIAGVRVGLIGGEYVINPSLQEMPDSTLDLVVAGTKTSVLMVESEAQQLSEETMLDAVMFGHAEFQPVIKLIEEFAKEAGKPLMKVELPDLSALEKEVTALVANDFRDAYKERVKQNRVEKLKAAKDKVKKAFTDKQVDKVQLGDVLNKLEENIVRGDIITSRTRIDGRDEKTIRPILSEVGVLPRTHGSALFTRGETQALVVATLGSGQDEQRIDALEGEYTSHFMLHYNFPPYSVGESTPLRAPGRREIGHGKLAWRALKPLLPTKEAFPYTMRLVSEITESNGSSSMATVCGSSLALMDAGVPLTAPVAGIAMGLIKEGDKFVVLSDIMGDEDHLGDMDFKVAGTEQGITSLQMDIKINGITEEIMKVALKQAKDGRIHILGEMAKALTGARGEVSGNAPKMLTLTINKDKIRDVIGSGGKVIRDICEKSGCKVDINDTGEIKIAAPTVEKGEIALAMIKAITMEPEIGEIYHGKVASIVDFGAFVNIGGKDGLVHVSELDDERVGKVTDILNEGDMVYVMVLEVDARGKIRLSRRMVDQSTGKRREGVEAKVQEPRAPRGDRNDRGRDRDRGDRKRASGE